MLLNFSNVLSLSRAGLALAFLQENSHVRLIAIMLAMVTDFFDGYIARRQRTTTQFGAVLDPIMDKFFVFFAGGIFYLEKKLITFELISLLSRDISICLFGLFLGLIKGWKGYECKSIWWGKIFTFTQFGVLIGLTLNVHFPVYLYIIFMMMASFAFLELVVRYTRQTT